MTSSAPAVDVEHITSAVYKKHFPERNRMENVLRISEAQSRDILLHRIHCYRTINNRVDLCDSAAYIQFIQEELTLYYRVCRLTDNNLPEDKLRDIYMLKYILLERIYHLHLHSIRTHPKDHRLWKLFLSFCEKMDAIRFVKKATAVLGKRVTEIIKHTELAVLAIQWQTNVVRNIKEARSLSRRVINIHPDCIDLLVQNFEVELKYIRYCRQMELGNVETGANDNNLSYYELIKCFKKVVGEGTVDVDIVLKMMGELSKYDLFVESVVVSDLIKFAMIRHPKEAVLNKVCLLELDGHSYDFTKEALPPPMPSSWFCSTAKEPVFCEISKDKPQCVKRCLKKYADCLEILDSEEMWKYYLDTSFSLSLSNSDNDIIWKYLLTENFRKNIVMSAARKAHDRRKLQAEHYAMVAEYACAFTHHLTKEDVDELFVILEEGAKQTRHRDLWLLLFSFYCKTRPLRYVMVKLMRAEAEIEDKAVLDDVWTTCMNNFQCVSHRMTKSLLFHVSYSRGMISDSFREECLQRCYSFHPLDNPYEEDAWEEDLSAGPSTSDGKRQNTNGPLLENSDFNWMDIDGGTEEDMSSECSSTPSINNIDDGEDENDCTEVVAAPTVIVDLDKSPELKSEPSRVCDHTYSTLDPKYLPAVAAAAQPASTSAKDCNTSYDVKPSTLATEIHHRNVTERPIVTAVRRGPKPVQISSYTGVGVNVNSNANNIRYNSAAAANHHATLTVKNENRNNDEESSSSNEDEKKYEGGIKINGFVFSDEGYCNVRNFRFHFYRRRHRRNRRRRKILNRYDASWKRKKVSLTDRNGVPLYVNKEEMEENRGRKAAWNMMVKEEAGDMSSDDDF